jgi:hypothetical protein
MVKILHTKEMPLPANAVALQTGHPEAVGMNR